MQILKNSFLFKLALFFAAICCIGLLITLEFNNNALKKQKDTLLTDIAEGEARIEAVQAVLDTPFDDEYIIRIAREKLNLRLPEEIVFYNDMND